MAWFNAVVTIALGDTEGGTLLARLVEIDRLHRRPIAK